MRPVIELILLGRKRATSPVRRHEMGGIPETGLRCCFFSLIFITECFPYSLAAQSELKDLPQCPLGVMRHTVVSCIREASSIAR